MRFFLIFVLSASTAIASGQAQMTAEQVIKNSISYHDPDGNMLSKRLEFSFSESRPNGPDRQSKAILDCANEYYYVSRTIDGREVEMIVDKNKVTLMLDKKSTFTESEKDQYRLTEDRANMMKNYYRYLWLLPGVILDPGTIIHPGVQNKDFFGKKALEVKITYEEEVGNDTWYFYFHPESNALIGYRFYHDESANDGEYIILDGEVVEGGLRIPQKRSWYTHKEQRFLGTDKLIDLQIIN